MSVLDPHMNQRLLGTLNNEVVMVGLNISRPFSEPFRNFHDPRPEAQDFEIRYAFKGTPIWGAYMTDLIKDTVAVESRSLRQSLTDAVVRRNVSVFLAELEDIGAVHPTILAFGGDVHGLLASAGVPAVRLTHYSAWRSKEVYREEVLERLKRLG
jgi:hypothetical protein